MFGFNIGFHLLNWLGSLPGWMLFGSAICVGLMIWGVAEKLIRLALHLGGWQAAIGVAGILALLVAAFWPRGREVLKSAREVLPGVASPIPRKRLTVKDLIVAGRK